MVGITLNFIVTALALYIWWVHFFCTYHTEARDNWRGHYKKGEKKTFPLWVVASMFVGCCVPGVNVIVIGVLIIWINSLHDEQDTEIRSFLFKKV